ncbi:glycoside hydrolase family 32 protein [Aspergillus brunneoviolaceus CBS 621.78]|uniref:Glycosyl hydrolase family protein n=1 Tax=Aspergillus brunneoviolaceus CBS 621.78 TaxID=1450534 RepID=A0ACD1G123_9EURO|nr:glycosyl hydrolase family protein [Aspergillus brunneoviolaceus CBS 621.78]RAH42973.1 glycosyl hydrolase family protein [Aspergillus brunneoviolaceus CBS 621.78]
MHCPPSLSDHTSLLHQETFSEQTEQWRPSFHITAPNGWLNDPCGLTYDPTTGLYHLSFQWNPKGNDWGNISWAHCTSSDLLTWKQAQEPCLTPSAEYDKCGVFTGCRRPGTIYGESGALTAIYTSVKCLPIHYARPYVAGSESISLATSTNGGTTWQRLECNPIVSGPPDHLSVTGWRDPFIAQWPFILQQPGALASSDLCGFVSGGIVGETPTVFVYSVNPQDLREWSYVGCLAHIGIHSRPSRWSGDLGVNWEVANFVSLTDDQNRPRNFIIMGAEGVSTRGKPRRRAARAQLWMSIEPSPGIRTQQQPLATFAYSGHFDHGCGYAANSFWDPVTSQHVVYCWIAEDSLSDQIRHQQGWSGTLSIPRVVNIMTLHRVMRARCAELTAITSIESEADFRGTCTVRTLGIRPDARIEKLRSNAHRSHLANMSLQNPAKLAASPGTSVSITTSKWELQAEISVRKNCSQVGLFIDHGIGMDDAQRRTTLSWNVHQETFIITRPSPPDPEIDHDPESAPHTLFTYETEQGELREETLRIHAFWDTSVLEVFVNERTVISTRIYLMPADQKRSILQFFAMGRDVQTQPSVEDSPALLLEANIWDGLVAT